MRSAAILLQTRASRRASFTLGRPGCPAGGPGVNPASSPRVVYMAPGSCRDPATGLGRLFAMHRKWTSGIAVLGLAACSSQPPPAPSPVAVSASARYRRNRPASSVKARPPGTTPAPGPSCGCVRRTGRGAPVTADWHVGPGHRARHRPDRHGADQRPRSVPLQPHHRCVGAGSGATRHSPRWCEPGSAENGWRAGSGLPTGRNAHQRQSVPAIVGARVYTPARHGRVSPGRP